MEELFSIPLLSLGMFMIPMAMKSKFLIVIWKNFRFPEFLDEGYL